MFGVANVDGTDFDADYAHDIGHPVPLLIMVSAPLEEYYARLLRYFFLLARNSAILTPLGIFLQYYRDTMTIMHKKRSWEVEV